MNLALFDFDGTITTAETFPAFMRIAIPPVRRIVGGTTLAPLVAAYRLGAVPATAVRAAIVRLGLRGVPEIDARETGQRFARDVVPGVIRPIALERIQWHKAQGDVVVVVSASLDLYLAEWCSQLGLDVICSKLEVRGGVLTGRYNGADCCGAEKVARIRERYDLRSYPDIYAYGDTVEDTEMLNLASKPYYRWQERARTELGRRF